MIIRKKLIELGHSKVIVIPVEWLNYWKDQTGKEIEDIQLEVGNETIIITPVKEKALLPQT